MKENEKNEINNKGRYYLGRRSWFDSPFVSFRPFYDDRADYNTNAKSYYDYLARMNQLINEMVDFINRLLDRDIEFLDTKSIDFTKVGSWIDNGNCGDDFYNDVIKIHADVIVSKATELKTLVNTEKKEFTINNGSTIKEDGLWSPDYIELLNEIDKVLGKIITRLEDIEENITNLWKAIEAIEKDITQIKNNISNLGDSITKVENALKKIVQNLYDSGAVTSNDIYNFSFKSGRNIATGNINFFGGSQDGNSFIRTNSGSTENDVTAGV